MRGSWWLILVAAVVLGLFGFGLLQVEDCAVIDGCGASVGEFRMNH